MITLVNKLIAIVGAPSSGKTTLINNLKKRGYNVISEGARELMPKWDVEHNRPEFQKALMKRQVELESNSKGITFCDTGRFCNVVYCKYYGTPIPEEFKNYLNFKYDLVFLLHPQKFIEDGIRKEKDVDKVWYMIYDTYKSFGQKVVPLPNLPPKQLEDEIIYRSLLEK